MRSAKRAATEGHIALERTTPGLVIIEKNRKIIRYI